MVLTMVMSLALSRLWVLLVLPLLVLDGSRADDTCCAYAIDCHDVRGFGSMENGPYEVKPTGSAEAFYIYCEFDADGTAWTLLQRRVSGYTDFNRTWQEYRDGFGVPGPTSNYWMGLDDMYEVTTQRQYTIRFHLKDWDGEARYADYGLFYIGDQTTFYPLMLDQYLGGTMNDSLLPLHRLARFATYDNDFYNDGNHVFCGKHFGAGWWYGEERCWDANFNGVYRPEDSPPAWAGITWNGWEARHSFKESSMRITPTF